MIIPSINSPDFETASRWIKKAEGFLPQDDGWIHIDVSDGKFTSITSWGNPEELLSLQTKLNIEVHLMVENPEEVSESWLKAGAKRLIVHVQTMQDPSALLEIARRYSAEIMLSLDPTQSIEKVLPYISDFKYFHILTVFPGPSGQKQQPGWMGKIKSLRERAATATIEIDGGIDGDTGRLAKDAGADILVSGHYIFGSPDPRGAYEKLKALLENPV